MPRPLARILDALVASDPGLNRLRTGLAGATCVTAAMCAEFLLGNVLGVGPQNLIVFMLLGSVIAMLGSNALARPDIRGSVRAAALFPVAFGLGLFAGILVGSNILVEQVAFVGVMFAAVYIRRFGLDFFFYGFLIWISYFFSLFLRPSLGQIPMMLLAVVTATAVVLLLCTTVFRPHPRRTLLRIFRSMNARRRAILRACAAYLAADDARDRERSAHRIFTTRTRFNETVLMSDGWAAHARALPNGWTAETLRRRLLDVQLSVDLTSVSSRMLGEAPREVRELASHALLLCAQGKDAAALHACDRLIDETSTADDLVRSGAERLVQSLNEAMTHAPAPVLTGELEQNAEFTPAAELTALGALPGSPSVSKEVVARGARWNPLSRLNSTTRQAAQVVIAGALAIAAGSAINGQRYYWAVIAAFVAFTGTGTRMETFGKSLNRVLGTLVGLGAGIGLANLTTGHRALSLVVIVFCVFCGFYLVRVSYAYMIFFVTIMVSQLYGILGQFSDGLLVLRLVETAAGAAIGMLVALVVAPVSTRDAVAKAESEVLGSVAELLDAAAEASSGTEAVTRRELDGLELAVDNNVRRLSLVAGPLTRVYLWESRPRQVRHRLTIIASCVSSARTSTARVRFLAGQHDQVAKACRVVAALARDVAGITDSDETPESARAADYDTSAPAIASAFARAADGDPAGRDALDSLASLSRLLRGLLPEDRR